RNVGIDFLERWTNCRGHPFEHPVGVPDVVGGFSRAARVTTPTGGQRALRHDKDQMWSWIWLFRVEACDEGIGCNTDDLDRRAFSRAAEHRFGWSNAERHGP